MTTKPQHTQTPLRKLHAHFYGVEKWGFEGWYKSEAERDNAFRAVNSHYALLEIAKELKDAILRGGDLQLGKLGRNSTLEKRVDEAIALAKWGAK